MTSEQKRRPSWWRGYLGGLVLLTLATAGVWFASGLESNTAALFAALLAVTAAIGVTALVFDLEVMPAAGLALLELLLAGATVRTVLPRPATTWDFRATTHRLAPELAGSTTSSGGKNRGPVTHLVVPLVPEGWRAGEPIAHWVFDPPKDPARRRGLRLSYDRLGTARDAWEDAVATHHLRTNGREEFLELVDDPQREDERRATITEGVVAAIFATWLLGKPIALAWRTVRRRT